MTNVETIQLMGWTLARVDGASEVRIHDLELGRRAGLSRPRDIRKAIQRLEKRGRLPGICHRAAVARRVTTPQGHEQEYEVTEYWLTRTEALKVVNALETPPAEAMQDEMIHVFELALDGRLPGQLPIDSAAIRAMLREEIAAALEPVTHRLEVIEHRPVASIGAVEQRALQDARERLASLRVIGKLSPNLKSAGRWTLNLIESASGWHGRGCKLTMLPVNRYQQTMAALYNAIRDAQTAADRERKPTLPFDPKAA